MDFTYFARGDASESAMTCLRKCRIVRVVARRSEALRDYTLHMLIKNIIMQKHWVKRNIKCCNEYWLEAFLTGLSALPIVFLLFARRRARAVCILERLPPFLCLCLLPSHSFPDVCMFTHVECGIVWPRDRISLYAAVPSKISNTRKVHVKYRCVDTCTCVCKRVHARRIVVLIYTNQTAMQ